MKNITRQHGFSLIEVMVATVLLMVIVTMVALVYRQNVLMWNSGMRRAEGMALVRLALGSIERDMRNAVNGGSYKEWNAGNGGGGTDNNPKMYVTDSRLAFVAFLGEDDNRELVRVTYDVGFRLTRRIEPLVWEVAPLPADSHWVVTTDTAKITTSVLIDEMRPSDSSDGPKKPQIFLEFNKGPGGSPADPESVTVWARLVSSEEFASIRVKSLGEKGDPEDKNSHIVVW